MKKIIPVIISLILAIGVTLGSEYLLKNDDHIDAGINNEKSLVAQEILSYEKEPKLYKKLYYKGELIGVINDEDYLHSLIDNKYKDYEADFPDTELGYGSDVYETEEYTLARFSNVDDQIMSYLVNNDLLGVKTTSVEFSTEEGVFEIIYVKHYEDFSIALERFLLNFISDEALLKLMRQETIDSPTELGTVEKSIYLRENIERKTAIVSPSVIFKNV